MFVLVLVCLCICSSLNALETELRQLKRALEQLQTALQLPVPVPAKAVPPVISKKPASTAPLYPNPIVGTKEKPSPAMGPYGVPLPPWAPIDLTKAGAPETKVPTAAPEGPKKEEPAVVVSAIDETPRTVSEWRDYFMQDPKRILTIKDSSNVWQTIFHVSSGLEQYTGSPSAAKIREDLLLGQENVKRLQEGKSPDFSKPRSSVDIAWEIYSKYQPYITNTSQFVKISERSPTLDLVVIKKAVDAWGQDAFLVVASYHSPWESSGQTGVSQAAIDYFNSKFGVGAYEKLLSQKLGY
ncbi:MAG: hypothetical protein WCE21_05720 [Candidatus Babeliales bacterium]